ncbi:hypothetical protein JB92DRAFT_2754255, partial [Gautieria morchelliformis]
YNTWAYTHNFESKLPKVLKAKRAQEDAVARFEQGTLDEHLKEIPKKEHVVPFTNTVFHDAAIEWLIITDQPIQALTHPSFKKMIDIGARATKGVILPTCNGTCDEIMSKFRMQLTNLKERLNMSFPPPPSLYISFIYYGRGGQ